MLYCIQSHHVHVHVFDRLHVHHVHCTCSCIPDSLNFARLVIVCTAAFLTATLSSEQRLLIIDITTTPINE